MPVEEMPVEAMPAPMSTVASRLGLWSEGNILFSLQSKANFILPKPPKTTNYTYGVIQGLLESRGRLTPPSGQ